MCNKYLLTTILIFAGAFAKAQNVGINHNATMPHASAILDVKNPNKGLLVPQVALTGTNDLATIATPETSLLIYNTVTVAGANSVKPGFYFWNGTAWQLLGESTLVNDPEWSLTGNAGLVAANHFIGTTDNVPVTIRVNDEKAGRIDNGNKNAFLGYQAGNANTTGTYNSATGYKTLYSNTTGSHNTASGREALYLNTTGINNVAIGPQSLHSNTTTSNNVAVGDSALHYNTASENTAVGVKALLSNTNGTGNTGIGNYVLENSAQGYNNTANGYKRLTMNTLGVANTMSGSSVNVSQQNTTGSYNTAFGSQTFNSNTTGIGNTGAGFLSLASNTTATYNTAVGAFSLITAEYGEHNTAIGYAANIKFASISNAIAIGRSAVSDNTNKLRLGVGATSVIEGQVAYSFPSDARFKYNIQNNVPGLHFIKRLTPVTYYFNGQKLDDYTRTGVLDNSIIQPASYNGEEIVHSGFLAQDVEKAAIATGYQFDGLNVPGGDHNHYSLAYSQFIMPLVKSVQEQQLIIGQMTDQLKLSEEVDIKKQEQTLIAQDEMINSQQQQLTKLKERLKLLLEAAQQKIESNNP